MTNITAAGHRTYISTPPGGFSPGQCTDYADRMFRNWNIYGDYIDWNGDASKWAMNARSKGWTVAVAPRAGSVVVYQPGVYGAGGVGHVAWVHDVYPNLNKVLISEQHFPVLGQTDYRLVTSVDTAANRYTGQPNIQYIYENPAL
jgi:surface antigen